MAARCEVPVVARAMTVRGRVQGVGFRYSALQRAIEFGVTGWVRNEVDGSVAVFAQGSQEAVDALVGWLRRGPPAAEVDSVDSRKAAVDRTIRSFRIAH